MDNPAWKRLDLPAHLFASDYSEFEQEINQLRTYQGQSDVFVMNPSGTITAPTFGGGANALVTELLGERATISSGLRRQPAVREDVPDIEDSLQVLAQTVQRPLHHRRQGQQHRHIRDLQGDGRRASRDYFNKNGPTPLFVVIGRGGPNLIRGMAYMRDTLENLKLPYRIFGHDSAMSEVVNYALNVDKWMEKEGRRRMEEKLGYCPGRRQRLNKRSISV